MSKWLQDIIIGVLFKIWEANKQTVFDWLDEEANTMETKLENIVDDKTKQMMSAGLVMVGGALTKTVGHGATDLATTVGKIIHGEVDDEFLNLAAKTFNDFLKSIGK